MPKICFLYEKFYFFKFSILSSLSCLNFRLLGIIRLVYPKPALPCRILLTFKFPLKLQMSIKTKKGGQSASLNVNKFKLSFVLTCRKQFALSLARFFISAFYIFLFLLFIFFFWQASHLHLCFRQGLNLPHYCFQARERRRFQYSRRHNCG